MIESILHLWNYNVPSYSLFGIVIIFITLILTGVLIRFQIFVIHQTNSLSIKADNTHYNGDLVMNFGVLISLILSYIFSIGWIDSVFGILVGLYLLKSGLYIIKKAISMLMDEELPYQVKNKIKSQLSVLKEIQQIRDFRTRQAGIQFFIQLTLILDKNMSLKQAHLVADQAEKLIHDIYPDSETMIHLEPGS